MDVGYYSILDLCILDSNNTFTPLAASTKNVSSECHGECVCVCVCVKSLWLRTTGLDTEMGESQLVGVVEASEKVKYVKNYEIQKYIYIYRASMAGDKEVKEIQPKRWEKDQANNFFLTVKAFQEGVICSRDGIP